MIVIVIVNIPWHDKIPDTDILQLVKVTSLHTINSNNNKTKNKQKTTTQLRWSGHVVRMDDNCLPKRLCNEDLATGKRSTSG